MHAAGRMRCSPAGMQSQTHPLIFTSHTFALMAITASLTFALFTYFRLPIISSVDAGSVVSCFSRTRQLQAAANEGVQLRPENLKTSHIWALHSRTVSEDSNGAFQVIYKDVESLDATLSPINGVPSTLDFTISAWVRLRHTTSESRCIASHGEPGERWSMLVVPSGNLQLSLWLSSGQKVVFECILALRLGVWSHIAVGYKSENGRASFYLNGHLVPHSSHKSIKNIDLTSPLSIQERPLYIGSCSYGNNSDAQQKLFHGDIGNFQIWDRFFPETEIHGVLSSNRNPDGAQLIYSLVSDDEINKDLQSVDLPAFGIGNNSQSALFTDRMSAFVTCKVESPMNTTLDNVRKPSSMTVMAWMRMSSLPYKKEACILSHGSWENGWKLSILPYLNLQLSVRSSAGDVLEFFSVPFTPSLHWQHISVSYNEEEASVIFYVNGFPLELESVPDLVKDRDYSIASQEAPLTIGRCYPDGDNPSDETLQGHISDVMVWDGVLDFQAIRSIARGETASAESVRELRHALPGRQLVFALPALGCIGEPSPTESLPPAMSPPIPLPISFERRTTLQNMLSNIRIMMFCTYSVHASFRVLDSIDHQAAALLDDGSFGTVQVAMMVNSKDMQTFDVEKVNDRYERLNIEFVPWNGESMVHAASEYARHDMLATNNNTQAPGMGADSYLLMMTDVLKPLEHWLEHLITAAVTSNSDIRDEKVSLVKSLTMTTAGLVKSVGLKHYLTVLGDARIVPAPYMTYRGYSPQYLQGFNSSELAQKIEAYTCESLLISSEALVAAAPAIPSNLHNVYECAALTGHLVSRGSVQVALNSWVLEIQPALATHRWDSGSESMVRFHEHQKHSAFEYAKVTSDVIMQNLNSELESNLRVKWMIACGGSWAWEAANLLEHLERRLPLRVQVQNPFQYCQGLQPFNDPLTYVERVQRLMELPSLDTENVDGNAADGNATYAYSLPFPQGTRFVQDDVVIYHRDWFRASNWNNWAVQRPRYAIGRFMNEVSGVHARVVQQCNMLDEVWVPSKHHVEIYASAGVERSKLVVVPESIDPNIFDPKSVEPLMLPNRKRYVFVSIFKFEERKNWKQLLWAYCKAFTARDDVSLFMHTSLAGDFQKIDDIHDMINEYVDDFILDGSTGHKDNKTLPHWEVLGKALSTKSLIGLYRSADAYVLPTHGEGWGLPYMEAMAMELPTIATKWGGNMEFMNENNALLIKLTGFEPSDPYDDWIRNFHWASPDPNHLAELMAWCFYNPDLARALGKQARKDVIQGYSNKVIANKIMAEFQRIQKKLHSSNDASESEVRRSLPAAFQWTIASDVKLCSNMPRAVNRPIMEENETLALVERDEGRFNETKHTESSSVDATSASDPDDTVVSASDDHSEGTGAVDATNNSRRKLLEEIECPTSPTRVAFITPFLPRHDGLAYYAEQLIRSSTQACPTITFDVFAVVLDFFSAYSETYNESDVRHVIFRESWVDYISAARVINEEYDAALINFKSGAFGGSSCAYAVCLVKSISKPVISIVHSINHHMDDELQFNILQLLTESDAALVASNRGLLALDTAVGFLPSHAAVLNPSNIHVLAPGVASQEYPSSAVKESAKQKLGLEGKTVLLTAGVMGPDKGPYFVLNALNKLPSSLLKNLTYIVAGRRDDCGAMCIEFYTLLEKRSQELKLTKNVIFMPEKLTEEGWTDLWLAADIAMLIYAEDLNPHPATYYEALSSGAIPITTPFAAALAEERGRSTVLTWDRDPDVVAAAIKSVLMSDALSVEKMREDAWKAVQDSRWKEFGYTLSKKVILPTIRKGRGALYNNDR